MHRHQDRAALLLWVGNRAERYRRLEVGRGELLFDLPLEVTAGGKRTDGCRQLGLDANPPRLGPGRPLRDPAATSVAEGVP
jgi:hypothetical protein